MSEQKMKFTFKNFMTAVNADVEARCGLGVYDLPDVNFHDFWWKEIDEADWNHMVSAAAEEALSSAGYME